MHAYVITAKPSRLQRFARSVRVCTVRILALLTMAALAAVVFPLRCLRPVVIYLATRAAWLELWASSVTGIGPVGAALGSGLTDEFVKEFHRARTSTTN
ncbi:hypothetical protein ACWDHW_08385 [Streptomyces melanosporofaciens]